jgi:predicted  nucleic acid-binding Zn-ribbon protein
MFVLCIVLVASGMMRLYGQQEAPSLNSEEALRKALVAYYQHMAQVALQVAKTARLSDAYNEFYKQCRTLPEFLKNENLAGVDSAILQKVRGQCKNKDRFAFFHPAALYDNYQELLLVLNPEKMYALQKEMDAVKAALAPTLKQKEALDKQKQEVEDRLDKQQSELNRMQADVDRKEKEIKEARERIRQIDSSISSCRDIIRTRQDRLLSLDTSIRQVERQLRHEQDPVKRRQLESRLQSLERDRDSLLRENTEQEREIDRLENERSRSDTSVEDLHQEIPRLMSKIPEYKTEVKRLAHEKLLVEQEWQACMEKLKPLETLRKKQEMLLVRLKQMEKWWFDVNFERRAKFVLALYVLENFPADYYEIKTKKWFGVGGIVEVYFW